MPSFDPEEQIFKYSFLVKQPFSYNGLIISQIFSLLRTKFKCFYFKFKWFHFVLVSEHHSIDTQTS